MVAYFADIVSGVNMLVGLVAGPDHDRAGMGGVEVRRVIGDEDRATS